MNTIIILNILCEGQTEEQFVKEVLKPYLRDAGIIVKHRLLITSKKNNACGGIISYQQVKRDLSLWINEIARRQGERHYFTTMFDLYALPEDFPGYSISINIPNAYNQVQNIEAYFLKDIQHDRFIPYIQLHEFEALLFCDIDKLKNYYPKSSKHLDKLKEVLSEYKNNPELINNSPQTAPSKRIIKAIEDGGYNYNKPRSGASVTKSIGINNLMAMCKHFKEWINKLKDIN